MHDYGNYLVNTHFRTNPLVLYLQVVHNWIPLVHLTIQVLLHHPKKVY